MSIELGDGTIRRNTPEQVKKNKDDIEELKNISGGKELIEGDNIHIINRDNEVIISADNNYQTPIYYNGFKISTFNGNDANKDIYIPMATNNNYGVVKLSETGLVDDVQVNGLSVVNNKIANIVVDNALNQASDNPVQNKVIKDALDHKLDKEDIDNILYGTGNRYGQTKLYDVIKSTDQSVVPDDESFYTTKTVNENFEIKSEDITTQEIKDLFNNISTPLGKWLYVGDLAFNGTRLSLTTNNGENKDFNEILCILELYDTNNYKSILSDIVTKTEIIQSVNANISQSNRTHCWSNNSWFSYGLKYEVDANGNWGIYVNSSSYSRNNWNMSKCSIYKK